MNNSLGRLIEGMVETLRQEILPHLSGEFERGQAFGLIYMLKFLQIRAAWSPSYLGEQISALRELAAALETLPNDVPRVMLPYHLPPDAKALEEIRDTSDGEVVALINWLGDHDSPAADAAVKAYIHRQLKHEIKNSARPMFAEISLGKE